MDIFGIGILEVLVVLVIALVVLGPARTFDMAKNIGSMLGQVRRSMGDLSKAVEIEENEIDPKRFRGEEPEHKAGTPPEERR